MLYILHSKMDALKSLVANRKSTSEAVMLRGEAEEQKKKEYFEKQAKLAEERDARLGKRLKDLNSFLEEGNSGHTDMFEPMKKVITLKKKNKKSEKEEEEQKKILEKDTTHRDRRSL